MSLTLGEKLRQAREERGFTLSEVAEQTRISPLYLECIENDDYSKLPGGIFNKGFVKSYAKFVGINEQEALSDYSAIMARNEMSEADELKLYKPEVLTDDRTATSMVPTIIGAVVIIGLMTIGILFLVRYLQQPDETFSANTSSPANTNTAVINANTEAGPPSGAPTMGSVKIEFKATTEPVSLSATEDGRLSTNTVAAGSSATFEPKERLKLSYSRSLAKLVQLTINGKEIVVPTEPLTPGRSIIEFEITESNLADIWKRGSIAPGATPPPTPEPSPDQGAETSSTPTGGASTPGATPRPAATPANRPAASNANTARPTPARTPLRTPAATPPPARPTNTQF